MLNHADLSQKADQLLAQVGELPAADALQVLNVVAGRLLEGVQNHTRDLVEPANQIPPLLQKRTRGAPFKIEADEEVRDFIHGLTCSMTYKQLEAACRERFGWLRAPSKSAIQRYVQHLKFPKNTNTGGKA